MLRLTSYQCKVDAIQFLLEIVKHAGRPTEHQKVRYILPSLSELHKETDERYFERNETLDYELQLIEVIQNGSISFEKTYSCQVNSDCQLSYTRSLTPRLLWVTPDTLHPQIPLKFAVKYPSDDI
jgi:hypothetical protein